MEHSELMELTRGPRGSGRTTKQLQAVMEGGIFICAPNTFNYTRKLADSLGLITLKLVAWNSADHMRRFFLGRQFPEVVFDHFFYQTGCESFRMSIDYSVPANQKAMRAKLSAQEQV